MTPPAVGDRLYVTGPLLSGFVEVAHTFRTAEIIRDVPGIPAWLAKQSAEDLDIELLCLVTYKADGVDCCCSIAMMRSGEWRDLQGSVLAVSPCRSVQ